MARSARHVYAATLAICLLILSSVVYPGTVAHVAHHDHHKATTHTTALCAWLCAAGQAIDTADIVVHITPSPSTILLPPLPEKPPPAVRWSSTSRGPPPFIS